MLFQFNDYTGNVAVYYASAYQDECLATTVAGEHAGSVNNNTNSVVWVYDHEAGIYYCLSTKNKYVLDHDYGAFYIQYGVKNALRLHQ